MAIRIASKEDADAALQDAKQRTPEIPIEEDSSRFFKDPSVHLVDPAKSLIFSLSHRGEFATFSFASSDSAPSFLELESLMTQGLNELFRLYGKPQGFSAVLSDRCPWLLLFRTDRNDTIVDNIYIATQTIVIPQFPGLNVVKLASPRKVIISSLLGFDTDLGTVYAHTDPILVDEDHRS